MTILIVDDEPLVRASLRFALKELTMGCQVVGEAENGEDALEQYRHLLPDVEITDVRMPGMNGLDFIETVRRTDHVTQFIIVSGFSEFEYARQAIRFGVRDYVLKPVKSQELGDALINCMDRITEVCEAMPEGRKLVSYIQEHYGSPLKLDQLSTLFNFSPKYISCLVKNEVGLAFSDFLISLRMKRAAELLGRTHQDVQTISRSVGYDDTQYFHRIFKKTTGKTPLQFRNDALSRKKDTPG